MEIEDLRAPNIGMHGFRRLGRLIISVMAAIGTPCGGGVGTAGVFTFIIRACHALFGGSLPHRFAAVGGSKGILPLGTPGILPGVSA